MKCAITALICVEAPFDQAADRFGARGFRLGLPLDPIVDAGLQLRWHSQAAHGMDARPGAAARSFLFNCY